ncbi:MAG: gamma-glutamylcyclotransferase, partial [Rhizobiaceae bacterium]
MAKTRDHFWIFGYGSLMWKPGFVHEKAVLARMPGVHRAPCIYSWVHRGTKDNPGIVLGLDRGGSCRGMAFQVSNTRRDDVLDYLRGRELVTNVYRETTRPAVLESGKTVTCVTYVVRHDHEQYAGKIGHDALVEHIANAEGGSGDNRSYFLSTVEHLKAMGIHDRPLERIATE